MLRIIKCLFIFTIISFLSMTCIKYLSFKFILFNLMFMLLTNTLLGQTNLKISTDKDEPLLFDTYQLFLDFELKSIEKLMYEKSDKPLKGYLDSDKTSIVLENYDGKGRVTVIGKDINGEIHEIKKSSCFIDPYVEL